MTVLIAATASAVLVGWLVWMLARAIALDGYGHNPAPPRLEDLDSCD